MYSGNNLYSWLFDMYNFFKYLSMCIFFACHLFNTAYSQPVGLENPKTGTKVPPSNKNVNPSPSPGQTANVPCPSANPTSPENKDKKENISEDEINDLIKNYKLIAVYLIVNEPRALIKNVTNPDEAPREFRIGDFIDELQKLSVSRIAFNPTARIELIDQSGFSYLLRESMRDVKDLPGSPKIPSSTTRSAPSYFSGGSSAKTKASSKKKPDAGSDTEPAPQEKAQDTKAADTGKASAPSTEPAAKAPSDASPPTQTQPAAVPQPAAAPQPVAQPAQPSQQPVSPSQSLQPVSTGSSQGSVPSQPAGSQPQGSTSAPSQSKDALQDRPSNPFQ